jgi:hypothetical protein
MKALLALLALTLAGCGYRPLYAEIGHLGNQLRLGEVRMDVTERNVGERRPAQLVATSLKRRLPATLGTAYVLNVVIEESQQTLAVRRDATDQRLGLNLLAKISISTPDGAVVYTGEANTTSAYNVEQTPYGTDAGKDRARQSAAANLSDEIVRKVALFLNDERRK